MVEVFKTNVDSSLQVTSIQRQLHTWFPDCRATIDLEDCDRVLRLEAATINASAVIAVLRSMNLQCEIMPD